MISVQLVGHARGSTTAMTTYRKDRAVEEQFDAISKLAYDLPDIKPFDVKAGLKSFEGCFTQAEAVICVHSHALGHPGAFFIEDRDFTVPNLKTLKTRLVKY